MWCYKTVKTKKIIIMHLCGMSMLSGFSGLDEALHKLVDYV